MSPILLNLLRSGLSSEVLSRFAPNAPSGIQSLLPQTSLGEQLTSAVNPLMYLTGLKQEAPSGNLQTDYMVSPMGVMDTAGNKMVTDQGIMGFLPQDQYGMDMPYNPATDTMGRDPYLDAFMQSLPDYSRMPTGEISTSPMTTQVPAGEYQSWWNPVAQPDLIENLPGFQQPDFQQAEQDEQEQRRRDWQDATGG